MVSFSCEQKCGRTLGCGNHACEAMCHEGECGLCPRDPIVLNTCACGKMPVTEDARKSCMDEVPTCDQVCGKLLKCGPLSKLNDDYYETACLHIVVIDRAIHRPKAHLREEVSRGRMRSVHQTDCDEVSLRRSGEDRTMCED